MLNFNQQFDYFSEHKLPEYKKKLRRQKKEKEKSTGVCIATIVHEVSIFFILYFIIYY